jgi:hypothetical protein
VDVGCSRVDASVSGAADRQMQDVGPQSVALEVAQGGALAGLVRAQELGVAQAGWFADAPPYHLAEGHLVGALGDQREHHEAAVVVGEPFIGRELLLVPVQHGEVVRGRRQAVHGNGHYVVGHRLDGVLVEVVTDSRAVGQEVLDRHVVVDQRKVLAQHRASCRVEVESAVLDEAHHTQGGEAFRSAREAEPRLNRIGDAIAPVRPTVCLGELHPAAPVDANHTGEPCRSRDTVNRALKAIHVPTVAAIRALDLARDGKPGEISERVRCP